MSPRQRFLVSAVAGGSAGSLLMDVTQFVWAHALERRRPVDDQDEETEAITSVVRLLRALLPSLLHGADSAVLGRVIHYTFGVAFAAVYFRALPAPRPELSRGLVFGTLLWLVSDRILIPLLKLGRPWSRYSVSERTNALASHLVYAVVVEFSRPSVP
jgi:hypothetical protein